MSLPLGSLQAINKQTHAFIIMKCGKCYGEKATYREHSGCIVKDTLCKGQLSNYQKEERISHAPQGGQGRAGHSGRMEGLGQGPVTEKHRLCTDMWVLTIGMVLPVGCGGPGTWSHKETDLKGLEGKPGWAF